MLANSRPIEVNYGQNDTKDYIRFVVGGGNIDLVVFAGPSAQQVVKQLTQVIGRPAMQEEWVFGLHQSRFGYRNVAHLKHVVNGYKSSVLPLDGIWFDIDYMDSYQDFTLDPVNFPQKEVAEFIAKGKSEGRKAICIIDPGIKINSTLKSFRDGVEMGIFMRDIEGREYQGEVWPGSTHFIDFFHPNATKYVESQLKDFKREIDYDGLWIDMNEPSNFLTGYKLQSIDIPRSNASSLNYPPYDIANGVFSDHETPYPLFSRTVPMDIFHLHSSGLTIPSFNLHNLYGLQEAKVFFNIMRKGKERPFLLTRSTFPGAGRFAATWLGDNYSTWEQMKFSLAGVMMHQLVGIPVVGADICGFIGNVDEKLCARWMALGAFYPFARNHNAMNYLDQEPFRWPLVAQVTKKMFALRYMMIPFWFTLLHRAHRYGEMMIEPISFNENCKCCYQKDYVDTEMIIGGSILVAPVLEEDKKSRKVCIPGKNWVSFKFDQAISGFQDMSPGEQNVFADYDDIPVFFKRGNIIPLYDNPKLNVEDTRQKSNYRLLVILGTDNRAHGKLYMDNGQDLRDGFSNILIDVKKENLKFFLNLRGKFLYKKCVEKTIKSIIVLEKSSILFKKVKIPLCGSNEYSFS